jgi:ribonuclease VapC
LIALDTSALAALALAEPDGEYFGRAIAETDTLIGTPTLLEARSVLADKMGAGEAHRFLETLIKQPSVHPVAFSLAMYYAANDAFDRYGRGRHAAKLNFGDCMAYAVAKVHDVPLLFKGDDFTLTDIVPAQR